MKEQINYYKAKLQYEIDAWDLVEKQNKAEEIVIIDTRSEVAFKKEHIPGAVNIPHRTINASTTAHLNKRILYITYCDGIGCNASTKGALNMSELGFDVKELIGGLDWWKRDGYKTEGENASQGQEIVCGC
jgi:rhodanese-related sulfurtransferase